MKCSLLEQHHSAHALLDQRYAERVPIHYRVTYTGTDGARLIWTEGSLRDLSKTDCKIFGSSLPSAGRGFTPTLYDDGQIPMALTNASVSWFKYSISAVWFPKLPSDQRRRIQAMIWTHVTLTPSKQQHAAFRIV